MSTEKYNNDDIDGYTPVGHIRDRRGVLPVTGTSVKECDTAGAPILGINISGGVTAPSAAGVLDEDHVRVPTGAPYDDLAPLTVDSQGRFVAAAPGDWVSAIAEEASAAADLLKRVRLLDPCQYRLGHSKDVRIATATPVAVDAATDDVIVVNLAVAGASIVNLPTGRQNMTRTIKDGKGDAAVNNITVTPHAGETIDGAATKVINANYGSIRIVFNGVQWNVI